MDHYLHNMVRKGQDGTLLGTDYFGHLKIPSQDQVVKEVSLRDGTISSMERTADLSQWWHGFCIPESPPGVGNPLLWKKRAGSPLGMASSLWMTHR